jgi:osmotically-inducible protein OsmY
MSAQNQQPAAPDNTKQNKSDGMTADNQKENKADRATSQKIRKAIISDKSLSSYAHNVKIITTNGSVTLKGPVRSDEEKSAIEAKATEVAGAGNVTSELTVEPKN